MAESIFDRISRLVSGKVEDSVDAMERAGGTTVMREAIRDVDRAIDEVQAKRDEVTVRRLQAVRQQKMFQERLDQLTEKARFALSQDREDLAEAALSRQVDFEAQITRLTKMERAAAEEERTLEEGIASLELRSATMKEELKAFEAARADVGLDAVTGESSTRKSEQRIERAEAAFKRAQLGAGGTGVMAPVDVENFKLMGELDTMQKKATVSDRLDALRKERKAS
ncbi:PspA/IM30 family protein [Fretibacter rubidus]|uniref:PspA/IM30 family protein n=1 Tax=Fretibacter rubidus TaxID=570162 RepID=UPI00352B89EA